jgi:integrase
MAMDSTATERVKPTAFTDKHLKSLKPKESRYRVSDASCTGLVIEITPAGNKNWLYRYKFNAKTVNMALKTSYPSMPLAKAREKVRELQALKATGINPIEFRSEAELEAKKEVTKPNAVTFKQAYDEYCQFKTTSINKSAPTWSYETLKKHNNRIYKHVMPMLGERIVYELTERDLELVLLAIQAHGTPANRDKVKTLFVGLFDWVRYHVRDPITDKPLMERNIALYIAKSPFPEHKSKPFKGVKTEEDLSIVIKQIQGMAGAYEVKQAIRLAMMLFLRPINIVSIEWSQIDFNKNIVVYSVEQMKMKDAFTTPLPKQAVELLNELKLLTGHSKYVFLSPYGGAGKHISRDSLSNALRRNGIDSINPHGFRHTASTLLNELGCDADEVEAQLSHSISGVRGIYNGANYLKRRRKLLQLWADLLDDLKSGADVIPINQKV